ncbi:MAG: tetratricopeptide repeat protein [Gemmataceae bacterium]
MLRLILTLTFCTSGAGESIGDLLAQANEANCEKRSKDAIALYSRVLAQQPDHVEALLGRSLAHEACEDAPPALADLEAITRKTRNHLGALVARARVLRRSGGDLTGALAACDAALKAAPNHPEALYQRAAARIAAPDPNLLELGRQDLDRYYPLDPLDVRYFVVLGHYRCSKGDFKGAKASFLEARRLGPDLHEGDFDIAMVSLADGELDEARRLLEGLRRSDRVVRRMKGRFGLVHLLNMQMRREEAKTVIEEALADDLKAAAPLLLCRAKMHYDVNEHEAVVRDCTECLKQTGRDIGEAFFYRGVAHAFCERYPEALVDLTASIRIAPDNFQSYRNRCIVNMYMNRGKEAAEDADQCAKLEPKEVRYVFLRGMLRKYLEEWDASERDFSAGLAIDPEFKGIHFERAQVRSRLGKFREAIADIEVALKQTPNDADVFALRAHCRLMLGDKTNALADYAEVKKLNRNDPTAHLMHAVLADTGLDEALKVLDQAIQDEPGRSFWRSQRASIYIKQGAWKKALEDCDECLKLEPNDVAALGNRALCWLSLENRDKAIEDCTRAIALDAAETNIWSVRCMAHFQKGNLKEALSDANEYLRRAPNARQAYANRATIYQALGETKKAEADAAKAAKLETTMVTNAKNATFSFAIGMSDIAAVAPPPELKEFAPRPPIDLPPIPTTKEEAEAPVAPPPPLANPPTIRPTPPTLPLTLPTHEPAIAPPPPLPKS